MEHTMELAQKGGVRYITGKVVPLAVALESDNRVCTGVRMEDGIEIPQAGVELNPEQCKRGSLQWSCT
jgi:hypothetical protein